jgi:hypothetical protein
MNKFYLKFPVDLNFDTTEFCEKPEIKNLLITDTFKLPLVDHKSLIPDFSNKLENLMGSKISKCRIFTYPPHHFSGIHIDGVEDNLTRWALNFPLIGSNESQMVWYKLNNIKNSQGISEYEDDRSQSITYLLSQVIAPIGSLTLDSPYIVRTDIPHNVINAKDQSRSILSVRFRTRSTEFNKIVEQLLNI